MSRKGNCWDNAVMEIFDSLKNERGFYENDATRNQAKEGLINDIEVFYNRIRRHLGGLAVLFSIMLHGLRCKSWQHNMAYGVRFHG